MRSVGRLVSVTLLLASFLLGCQAMTGKTAGENIDDASITAAVKAKLADETPGTLTRIDVDTNRGTVYLNGVVENETRRQRAAELASRVSGVRRVVNNLTVQTPG